MPQVLCARCKRDYLDQYDSCPWCGLRREKRASTGPVSPTARPSPTVSAPIATPQTSTTASAPITTPNAPTASAPIAAPNAVLGESLTLGRVLMSIAVIWALIGFGNVMVVFLKESSQAMRSFAFLFGVLFFLFPSLAFFAWGFSRNSRITRTTPPMWTAAAGIPGPSRGPGAISVLQMPVWQLSWYAMKMPFEQFAIFLRMAIIPIAIAIAMAVPSALLYKSPTTAITHLARHGGAVTFVALILAVGVKLFVEIPFQVGWLRFVVLGESTPRERGYFRFDATEIRYLQYMLLLALISVPAAMSFAWMQSLSGVPANAAAAAGAALIFLGLLAMTTISWVRLAFVLPEIATNRFESFQFSWTQSKGIGWQLLAIIIVATLPLQMASATLLEIQGASSGFFGRFSALAVVVFFDYASRASMLAAIAIAYRDWAIQPDKASRESIATVA